MATPSHKKHKHKHKHRKKKNHQRSQSAGLNSRLNRCHSHRKAGPIDIGRIKYKGTKYKEKHHPHFMKEKIPFHSRTTSFELRKRKNPVPKRPNIKEIGTPFSWKKPKFYKAESERMKRKESNLDFLQDKKPIHVRDRALDKLKDVHLPKGTFAQEEIAPFTWKPPPFELYTDKTHFLNEKLRYEASKVAVDHEFAHLLQTLSPEKLVKIKDIPPPIGYESKINYLKKLKEIVFEDCIQNRKRNTLFSVSLTALNDENENDKDDRAIESSKSADYLSLSSSNKNGFDIEKDIENALEEILAPSPSLSPQPPNNELFNDTEIKEALDEIKIEELEDEIYIDNALDEILAPSPDPSPQPPREEEVHDGIKIDRKALMKTIRMNLNDIQSKNKKGHQMESKSLTLDLERKDWMVDDTVQQRINIDDIESKYRKKKKNANNDTLSVLSEKKEIIVHRNKGTKYKNTVPTNFICPISKSIMNEAVIASDGKIYDKQNIENYLKTHDKSPVSGQRLRHKNLMAFGSLTDKINSWKIKNRVKKRKKRQRRVRSLKVIHDQY